ncbi:hypothetical protein HI914_04858 [Erysiphe necator]|nr:hypothetical protein HI914_04858 [Erysiphe necator]
MVKQDVLERRMKSQSNAAVEQIAKSESRMTNRIEEMSSRMDKLEQMNNRMDRVESAILEMSRTLKAMSNPNSDTKSEHTSGGPSTDQLESQLPQTFSTPASSFHKVQTFYQLSKNDRECDSVRDTFVDIVKTGMPQVWLHVQPQMKDKSTREGIELLVQIANRMMSWPSQINLCTNSATSFPTTQRQPELSNKRYYKPNNNQKSYLVELNDKNTDELFRDAFFVAIGIDNCKPTSIKHPIREGYGKSHNLFLTRFSNFPSVVFSTFFDYGCPSCYISSSLAFKLNPYKSTSRSIMFGIGGKGPTVTHDVLVNAQFCLSLKSKEYWTTTFTVSVGLAPDKTFPGDLVLGQTMFHALGLQFLSNGKVKLLKLLNEPVLTPTNNNNSQTLSSFSATEMRPIKWHTTTT